MAHSIEVSEERGVRYLHFGTEWVQGAMRLSRPHQLVLAYTQEMLSFLLFRPAPLNVLMIGLGAGSLPKFFRKELPTTSITVVEVNPAVIPIARDLFRVPANDERLDVQVGDGYAWVQESGETFDAIFVDGYDHRARPGKFETPAFYDACVARLAPQGVLVSNVFGQVRGHAQTMRHLREAFPRGMLRLPSAESKNVVVSAFVDPPATTTIAQLRTRAEQLRARLGLPFHKWVHTLQQNNPAELQSLFR
jgi:spermidine synthase